MGSFCGTNSQTVVSTATNPNVTNQQNTIYGVVNGITDQYAANPSALVAPWNSMQTTAAQGIADNATSNLPWNYLGQGMVGQGSAMAATAPYLYGQAQQQIGQINPLQSTPWNPTQYESPYTQDVINSTMANINRNNAIQQNGALGNAISQGNAFGGDRAGIAMGELARNQALASNQTMAQLQQADFNQASQQANAQQQYNLNLGLGQSAQDLQKANAISGLGSNMVQAGLAQGNLGTQTGALGNQGQSGALSGLGALFNAGSALQQTQQQQVSSPLTLAQWMATNSPGTSATPTSTTYPGSSPAATIAGLGLTGVAGAGLLSNLGFLALAADGGRINKQAGGSIGSMAGQGDIVHRFNQIRQALQSGGGVQNSNGSGSAIIDDYPKTNQLQTAQALRQMQQANLLNTETAQHSPLEKQLAYSLMQQTPTLGAASGGRQGYQDGGDALAGGPNGGPDQRKLFNKIGQMGQGMLGGGNSPLQAPHAPNSSMDPQNILKLIGQMARGGTISGIGRQDGGGVGNDPGDGPPLEQFGGGQDLAGLGAPPDVAPPSLGATYGYQSPPAATSPRLDLSRYMDKDVAKRNALMAIFAAGAGMMAHGADRTPQGTAKSGASGIGAGLQEGIGLYAKQDEEQRKAAFAALQLEAQLNHQKELMAQQAGIAAGVLPNGQRTMAGENHIPALEIARVNARKAQEQEKLDQQYRDYLKGLETPTPNGRAGAIPQASYTQQAAPGGQPQGVPPPQSQNGAVATQPQGVIPASPSAPPVAPEPTLDNVAPPPRAPQQRTIDPDQMAAQAYLDRDKQRLQVMVGTNQPGADALEKRIMEIEKLGKYPLPGKGFVPLPGFAESDARAAAMKTTEDVSAKMGAEYHADVSKGVKGAGTIAANQQQNLKLLQTLMADRNFASGTAVNWQVGARQALATAGINPDAAAPNEVFDMIMGRVLADQFAGLKSMSPMLAIEEKALPHASDTWAGKQLKVAILDRAGQLMIRWANKVDDYEGKYGRLDPNFDKALRNEVAQARVWGSQLGVRPEDEQRAAAELDQMRRGGQGGQNQNAAQTHAPAAIRQQLLSLPDDTPGGRIIKRGTNIIETQGALGTRGNPLSHQTDVTEAGQHAYDNGKIWRRNNNWLANRWDEVQ